MWEIHFVGAFKNYENVNFLILKLFTKPQKQHGFSFSRYFEHPKSIKKIVLGCDG